MQAGDLSTEIAVEGLASFSTPAETAEDGDKVVLTGFRQARARLGGGVEDMGKLLLAVFQALVRCPSASSLEDLVETMISGECPVLTIYNRFDWQNISTALSHLIKKINNCNALYRCLVVEFAIVVVTELLIPYLSTRNLLRLLLDGLGVAFTSQQWKTVHGLLWQSAGAHFEVSALFNT